MTGEHDYEQLFLVKESMDSISLTEANLLLKEEEIWITAGDQPVPPFLEHNSFAKFWYVGLSALSFFDYPAQNI